MNNRLYLDWNATAPLLPAVQQAMVAALSEVPGNASSVHREGQMARAIVERARRALAQAINAPAQAVVFSGGATESNNQVLRDHAAKTEAPFIVCTAVEHPSVLEVVADLSQQGIKTATWPVDERGRLKREWLAQALKDGATLVSVMWANNEMGNIFDIKSIAEEVHQAGALLHVDATQALGRIKVDFSDSGADFMTLSLHKMGGPKGIGATIVKEGLKIGPIMAGGHQERGRRPGTENIPAAAGCEAACLVLTENISSWTEALIRKKGLFLEELRKAVPQAEFRGDLEQQLPNTVNVAFPGLQGEDLLLALDLEGVAASSGSACTAGSLEPSQVILAMGFDAERAKESLRFSFGPMTADDDLIQAARRIGQVVERLRQLGEF